MLQPHGRRAGPSDSWGHPARRALASTMSGTTGVLSLVPRNAMQCTPLDASRVRPLLFGDDPAGDPCAGIAVGIRGAVIGVSMDDQSRPLANQEGLRP